MREIKFRVWDIINKKFNPYRHFIDSSGLLFTDCDPHGIEMSGSRRIRCNPHYVLAGEFTGKTDKNGVEIYEGDILKFDLGFQSSDFDNSCPCGIQGYSSTNGFVGTVEFDKNQLQFYITDIKFEKGLYDEKYVFQMSTATWTRRELDHYMSIRKKPLNHAKNILNIGNIYESL